MRKKYLHIARCWILTPHLWISAVIILSVTLYGKHNVFVPSYSRPSAPAAKHQLTLLPTFDAEDAENIDGTGVLGLDARYAMQLTQVQRGRFLENFPSLQWLHLDADALRLTPNSVLDSLQNLKTLTISDAQIDAEDLEKLGHLKALETLRLETMSIAGSGKQLAPLAGSLRVLQIVQGSHHLSDETVASPYRKEFLEGLQTLSSLEELVLAPHYIPGLMKRVGSEEYAPLSEPVLKANAAAALKNHPSLRHLWIGSHERPSERESMAELASALPNTRVSPARTNSGRHFVAGFVLAFSMIAFGLMGITFFSHFSTPQSLTIPGYREAHRRFILMVFTAAAMFLVFFAWTKTTIHISAVMSLVCWSIGMASAVHVTVVASIAGDPSPRRMSFLSFGNAMIFPVTFGFTIFGVMGFVRAQGLLPSIALTTIDLFLLGEYWGFALLIAVIGFVVFVWTTKFFVNAQRMFAEANVPAAVSVRELGKAHETIQSRARDAREFSSKKGQDAGELSKQDRVWNRGLAKAMSVAQPESIRRIASLWQYGYRLAAIRRIYLALAVLFAVAVITMKMFSDHFGVGAAPAGRTVLLATFLMLFYGMVINVQVFFADCLSTELLRPATRETYVRAKFFSNLMSCGTALMTTMVMAIITIHILVHPVEINVLLRGVFAAASQSMLAAGLMLWALKPRHSILMIAAVIFAIYVSFSAAGFVTLVLFDGFLPVATEKFRQDMHAFINHPVVLPGFGVFAVAVLAVSYRAQLQHETGLHA